MVFRTFVTMMNFSFYKRLFNFYYSMKVLKNKKMQVIIMITCIFQISLIPKFILAGQRTFTVP